MIKKTITFILLFAAISFTQPERNLNSSEIKIALEKLKVLGSVLYIAAHPDDENTKALAFFSKGRLVRTGYLSLTRGDGGQNLIGDEQGDLLGIIRTHELIEARKIDGAEQFFTRAIDFGYSKTPDETLAKWDKQKILSDVVRVIRNFQPDIIITRFPVTGQGTHGHHTASAILALEAFRMASDPNVFPEQLLYVDTWQPARIYWNAWTPAFNSLGINPDTLLKINLGEYNPLLGKSYTEISAEARSMHKSQGFGDSGWRADFFNHFLLLDGSDAKNDIFENIDLSWNKINGGFEIEKIIDSAILNYNYENPSAIVPLLIELYEKLQSLTDNHWKKIKSEELLRIIKSCTGIWTEAIADDYLTSPGSRMKINAGIVNRSELSIELNEINLSYQVKDSLINTFLMKGEFFSVSRQINLPEDMKITQPYWLESEHFENVYQINDQKLIGLAVTDFPLNAEFNISFGEKTIVLTTPVFFRRTDPVEGEVYRQIEIAPPVTINFEKELFVFSNDEPKKITFIVRNNSDQSAGTLKLNPGDGWRSEPESHQLIFNKKNEEQTVSFLIYPPVNLSEEFLEAEFILNQKIYNRSLYSVSYSHIPIQTYYPAAKAKLAKINIGKKLVENIGYIPGSGDKVPEFLKDLGFNVTLLTDQILTNGSLNKFDVIISGIRAYNKNERAFLYKEKLLEYISNGGTYIVQYNTSNNLQTETGPYPFKISRDRVTEEDSPVKILHPEHKIFNYPNKITSADFDSWIQERGLYFAGTWDEKYFPMLEMNDTGEPPKTGALLYTEYGKGKFIYTGLSFFRQIPGGVPGAYRLFINLISVGADE